MRDDMEHATAPRALISRRTLLAAGVAAAAIPMARAQNFPDKPIRLLVGYGPGGMDVSARLLAQRLATVLGQQIVVENRPGANGLIAAQLAAQSPADGYTLLLGESGLLVLPHLQKMNVDPLKSFTPVAGAFIQPSMIVVNNNVKASTPQELIALLKANPGHYSYSTSGIATPNALGFEMMKAQTNSFVVHVPYRGAAQILTAVVAGDVPIGVMSAVAALPFVRSGQVRGVAMLSPDRLPETDSIRPLADALPGFNVSARQFVLAPAGLPAPVLHKLEQAIRSVIGSAELAQVASRQGNVPWPMTSAQLAGEMGRESAHWAKVIKTQNLKLE